MLKNHFVHLVLGLHLNITEGIPLGDVNQIQTLVSSEGVFLGKHGFRNALQKGAISLAEVSASVLCINLFGF